MNKCVEGKAAEERRQESPALSANVALAVNNLPCMKKFYQEVLGFELMGEFPSAVLLRVKAGCNSRGQKLGLLQRCKTLDTGRGRAEHVAFLMPVPDPDMERRRLEGLGLKVAAINLGGIERGLLSFHDPEGNEVELLCCGPMLDN